MKVEPTREQLQIFLNNAMTTTKRLDNGCLVMTSRLSGQGYGVITLAKVYPVQLRIARVVAVLAGKVPRMFGRDIHVRHTCNNPPCIEDSHVISGTPKDNAHDMLSLNRHRNQVKTHCKNGHEFTPENIRYRYTYPNPKPSRTYIQCVQIRDTLRPPRRKQK